MLSRASRALALAGLVALAACSVKAPPPSVIPARCAYEKVDWLDGPDGSVCLDPVNAARLKNRELEHMEYERILQEALRAAGFVDPPGGLVVKCPLK
jgi:hypothetical protein